MEHTKMGDSRVEVAVYEELEAEQACVGFEEELTAGVEAENANETQVAFQVGVIHAGEDSAGVQVEAELSIEAPSTVPVGIEKEDEELAALQPDVENEDEGVAAVQASVEAEDDEDEELAAVQATVAERRAEAAAATAANRPAHVVVPELTEGKTHHLFISHAEEDTDWVSSLVKTLEEDKGLKCQWYKRDFMPGRSIPRSIQQAMLSCMKVLFIITPDFLASSWCMSEVDWAIGMSLFEKKCLVIPLLLRNCELPMVIKNLLYIDVPKGQDHIDRIIRSFDDEDENQSMVPRVMEFVPQTGSGLTRRRGPSKAYKSSLRGTRWYFAEVGLYKDFYNKVGSKFAADMYERGREIVNASHYMRYFSLGTCSWQNFLVTFALMALTSLIFILIGLLIVYTTKDFSYTNYLHIVYWPAVIMIPVTIFTWKVKSFSKVRQALWRLSLVHFKNTNILLDLHSAQIIVMYYDVNPCLDYLTERFLNARQDEIDYNKAQARVEAYEKIRHYLETNMETFILWKEFFDSKTKRHQTYLNKMCLCERIVK